MIGACYCVSEGESSLDPQAGVELWSFLLKYGHQMDWMFEMVAWGKGDVASGC